MNMKQLRERAGLRTVDVASALGIGESTVRNWEHARSVPRFETIKPLLNLYQCSFGELDEAVRQSKQDKEKITDEDRHS